MMFTISRRSGKSNSEVLSELIAKVKPGDLIEYDTIARKLSEGSGRRYTKAEVQAAICQSERKLAVTHQRCLINVRRVGYRVALAAEHQKVAGRKSDRASKLLKRGLVVLQHVDWDAMDDNTRKAHEGQLMVTSAMHAAMASMESRMQRMEDKLRKRND